MALEPFLGLMGASSKGSGKIIKCMVKVSTSGLMGEDTKESISLIKSMEQENIDGQTEEFIEVAGIKVYNTALVI